jgi:hypothetical protein
LRWRACTRSYSASRTRFATSSETRWKKRKEQDKLPAKIKTFAEGRRETAIKDSWLEGEKTDLLGFTDFGHLALLIIDKWEHFKDIVPSQHWLKQRMDELEKVRNFIAHNRMLLPSEFQRIYMYVDDWNKAIGI